MRYLWAGPTTLVGLMLALFAGTPRRVVIVDGVFEAHGPALRWMLAHLTVIEGGADAITLGHVILGRDAAALALARAHERVHVRQYERWGPLFLPAYGAASLWAVLHCRHFYLDNRFEREARRLI